MIGDLAMNPKAWEGGADLPRQVGTGDAVCFLSQNGTSLEGVQPLMGKAERLHHTHYFFFFSALKWQLLPEKVSLFF